MTAELLAVRLLLTIPAALGALLAVGLLCGLLRIREPRLRATLAILGVIDTGLGLFGVSALSFLMFRLVVEPGYFRAVTGPFAGPVLAVWLVVAYALVLVRLRRRRRVLGALRSLAHLAPPPSATRAEIGWAARRAGLSPPPAVWSPDAAGPCLFGGTLLLPAATFGRLAPAARRAALLHEMAHARRRDGPRCLLLGLLSDVFWFNPPLRALLRAWGRECEALTDRLALRLGASRAGLARSLASLVGPVGSRLAPVPALGAESPRSLARRVGLIADPPRRSVLLTQFLLLALLLPVGVPGRGGCRIDTAPPPRSERGQVAVGLQVGPNLLLSRLLPLLLRRPPLR